MEMVLQNDFIERFAAKGYKKCDSKMILNDFFATISECLAGGEDQVRFTHFGTFTLRERKDHETVKLGTGERYRVPAVRTVTFKPSAELKRLLNASKAE